MVYNGDTMGWLTRLIPTWDVRNPKCHSIQYWLVKSSISSSTDDENSQLGSRIPYANQPRGILKF